MLLNQQSNFLFYNIRSLKHKVHELQTVTQINEVAIVAVTETWLKETVFRGIVCTEMIVTHAGGVAL